MNNVDVMTKMIEMLKRYEEKAAEADNSIETMKKQFEEQLGVIRAKNHEWRAHIENSKKDAGEKT